MNTPFRTPYVLYGAGGHGLVVAEILELCNCEVLGFIDDHKPENYHHNYSIWPGAGHFLNLPDVKYIFTIGSNKKRKELDAQLKLSYGFAVHPSAIISTRAIVDAGAVIMAGVCVNTLVHVGRHCILNTNCTVDHECTLEDYVHVSPGAVLCGNVYVGEGAHIGAGATILPGIHIGKNSIVGAGAVVTKNVEAGTIVTGVPAINTNKYNQGKRK